MEESSPCPCTQNLFQVSMISSIPQRQVKMVTALNSCPGKSVFHNMYAYILYIFRLQSPTMSHLDVGSKMLGSALAISGALANVRLPSFSAMCKLNVVWQQEYDWSKELWGETVVHSLKRTISALNHYTPRQSQAWMWIYSTSTRCNGGRINGEIHSWRWAWELALWCMFVLLLKIDFVGESQHDGALLWCQGNVVLILNAIPDWCFSFRFSLEMGRVEKF